MSELHLIDTSVWIYALRKKYDPKIRTYVESQIEEDRIVINPIIKLELLSGTRIKAEFNRLKLRLDSLPEINIDKTIWEESQRIVYDLRRKGLGLPLVDILIIACAKTSGCRLVHKDRHFEMAGQYISLKLKSFL
ncbi:MAG: PIN domain-containing protein [Candidatus Aminicenantes bacterium]|jgi:predicted nucleic acid-binding protein